MSIGTTTYQAIPVYFLPGFGFKTVDNWDRVLKISMHKAFIYTVLVFEFQRSTSSRFRVISESITF